MPFPSLLLRDQKLADAGILFIERLMAVLPQKRLNASDARSDPWLESVIEPAMELRRRASVEDISDTGSMAQLRDRSSGSSGSSVRNNTLAEVAPNDGNEAKSAVTTPTASQDAEIIDTSTTEVDGLITSPGGVTLTMGNDPVDRINYDVPSHFGGSGRSARSVEERDLDGKPRPKLAFRNQHGLIGLTLDSIPRIVAAEQANEQRPDAYRHAYSSLIPLNEAPRPVNGHQMGQRSEHREGSESPAASVSGLNSSPTSSAEAWLNDWLFSKDSTNTRKYRGSLRTEIIRGRLQS